MKRLTHLVAVVAVGALAVSTAFADTLLLKNGTRVAGYYEGGTARVVKFSGGDGVAKDYDIRDVQEIRFDGVTPAAAAPATQPARPSNAAPATTAATPTNSPA